jgi:AmpE protein
MTLISLLLALLLERWKLLPTAWQWPKLYASFCQLFQPFVQRVARNEATGTWYSLVIIIVFTGVVGWVLPSVLSFVFSTLILTLCLGNAIFRQSFRAYRYAASRGDWAAADLHLAELQAHSGSQVSGERGEDKDGVLQGMSDVFAWCHYRYYLAVMVWFVLLGPMGAVLYVSVGLINDPRATNAVDAVSARVVAFMLLLVGHFAQGIDKYVQMSRQHCCPQALLMSIVRIAEPYQHGAQPSSDEHILRRTRDLMTRGLYAWLVAIALATLAGWL